MSDTVRGLIIGLFVGLLGGMLIGATVTSMVREYTSGTGLSGFIIDYGQIIITIIGIVVGVVGAYRMLQNLEKEREEESM